MLPGCRHTSGILRSSAPDDPPGASQEPLLSEAISGARIKAMRQARGLSQVGLAALLGVSNVTVNRWENDTALPQSATIARLLRLEQDGAAALAGSPEGRRGNLPRVFTPLVGRAADLESLARLLASSPWVTVTGTAGAGKTWLALEAGRINADRWADGVWFVDLAAVGEPGDVEHAVARVLGVREAGANRCPIASGRRCAPARSC